MFLKIVLFLWEILVFASYCSRHPDGSMQQTAYATDACVHMLFPFILFCVANAAQQQKESVWNKDIFAFMKNKKVEK